MLNNKMLTILVTVIVLALGQSSNVPLAHAQSPVRNGAADLLLSTFLGGSSYDIANAMALDSAGNIYITGYTNSSNFPTTTGAYDTSYNGGDSDVFVVKLNSTGNQLIYATFLGGITVDEGNSIFVDTAGNAYVTGTTDSGSFPTTTGAYDTTYNGNTRDVFVAKLNPNGTGLVYSTFLGGGGTEFGTGIVVDSTGNAFVTGQTDGATFPTTTGAYDTTHNGFYDGFITKLNPSGTALIYSTLFGDSDLELASAIAIDKAGNAYVTGQTNSLNFPTTNGAFGTTKGPGAFVVKLQSDGNSLAYATVLGGNVGWGIAVNDAGNAFVTGLTTFSTFPTTAGAFKTVYGGGPNDAFVVQLNTTGTALVYSTFLGGNSNELGGGIFVDGTGNAYVGGYTMSADFPTTTGAYDTSQNGFYDIFVTKLNNTGTGLLYSTYVGGTGGDEINWVNDMTRSHNVLAVDTLGNAHIVGRTVSADFPTTVGAYDTTYNGGTYDSFVTKISTTPPTAQPSTTNLTFNVSGNSNPASQTINLTSTGGAASWTASSNQTWLTLNSLSGTTPASITVSVNISGLASGTHTGQITLSSGGQSYSIAVTLTVPPQVNVTNLTFNAVTGGAAATSQNLTITSNGAAVNWTASSSATWLTLSSLAGTTPSIVQIIANPSGLAAGSYSGQITLTAGGVSQIITISFTVMAVPTVSVTTLNFTSTATTQNSFTLQSTGLVSWTASSNVTWLSFSQSSGNTPATVTVNLTNPPTTSGSYNGQISLNLGGVTQTINVTLVVPPTGNLQVTCPNANVTAMVGGTNPPAVACSISSTGAPLNWTASEAVSWLNISPSSGTTPTTLTVSVDITGLAAGSYTGQITLTSGNNTNLINVTLNVSPPPTFNVTQLTFTGTTNAPQSFTISGGNFSWTATTNQTWLTLGQYSGTAPATVSVFVNRAGLPVGTNTGQISLVINGVTYFINVSVVIETTPQLLVSPTTLNLGCSGTQPNVTITNNGGGTLTWTVTESLAWLTVSPLSGTNNGPLALTVDCSSLANGSYSGQIAVTANGQVQLVNVTLNKSAEPLLQLSPTSFTFNGTIGSSNPAAQILTISNGGGGSFNWTISGAPTWLTVSPASGSNSSGQVQLTANLANMSAGSNSAMLIVTANGVANGTQFVNVSFNIAPQPVTPVTITPVPTITITPIPTTVTPVPTTVTPIPTDTPVPPTPITPTPTPITPTPTPITPTPIPTGTPGVVFQDQNKFLCQTEPMWQTVSGVVHLPSNLATARLQLQWYVVSPRPHQYQNPQYSYSTVRDGQSFSLSVYWPGINPDSGNLVQNHVGAALLDERGVPLPNQSYGSVDYYWNNPANCPRPARPQIGAVNGTVTRKSDGAALSGVAVQLYRKNGSQWVFVASTSTSSNGFYSFESLAPGSYRVTFSYQTFQPVNKDITVTVNQTARVDAVLDVPVPPVATVSDTCKAVATFDKKTGQMVFRGTPNTMGSCDITIQTEVICTAGTTPSNITLLLNRGSGKSYTMQRVGNNQYSGVIPRADVSGNASSNGTWSVKVKWNCGTLPKEKTIGTVEKYDPSGFVTNVQTGAAVVSATVTLHRVPGWVPRLSSSDPITSSVCETTETRGTAWSQIAPAEEGEMIDADLELLSESPTISPTINPLITGSDGYYGWDVAEGCWYVTVEADGYEPKVSFVVGVPPAVTDLDIALQPLAVVADKRVYLPLIVK